MQETGFARGEGVVGTPFPDPLLFRAHVTGTPGGRTGEMGEGGSPEVPQHKWLRMIPHNALIILRYVLWVLFFEK